MGGTPQVGLSTYNVGAAELVDIARAADRAGFDSLWLGEHVVLPWDYGSVHPAHDGDDGDEASPASRVAEPYPTIIEPTTQLIDPCVALAGAATVTTRLKLATGIYLLPLRHPLVTARAAATLDGLSGGRFMLGVGSGWLREEFAALAVPFEDRGQLYEESLEVLRAAFRGGPFQHSGKQFQTGDVQVSPRPVSVPLVLGGNSDKALSRAARLADAWFSSGTPSFEEAVRLRDRLEHYRLQCGRTEPLPAYFRVPGGDLDVVPRYVAEGMDKLIFWVQNLSPPGRDRQQALQDAADSLGL
jgi:probable F420-dependent oxidoreductase